MGRKNVFFGNEAVSIDLCKLSITPGLSHNKVISNICDTDTCDKKEIIYHGLSLGYHDYMIVSKMKYGIDGLYDRSLIDRIEEHITSHHRFLIFPFRIADEMDERCSLFSNDVFCSCKRKKNKPLLLMIMLKINYSPLGALFGEKQDCGYMSTMANFVEKTDSYLTEKKRVGDIYGYGIGGTLGMYNVAMFISGNNLKKLLGILSYFRGVNISEFVFIENNAKQPVENDLIQPLFESSYTIPSINSKSKKILLKEDKVNVYLRMSAASGSNIGFEAKIQEELNLHMCNSTLGKVDFLGARNKVRLSKYIEKLIHYLDGDVSIEEIDIRNIIWSTESSISVPNSGNAPISSSYQMHHLNDKRKKRPKIHPPYERVLSENEKKSRNLIYHSLNKALSIGHIARYDMDKFAYSDMLPFMGKVWYDNLMLNTIDMVINAAENLSGSYIQYSKKDKLKGPIREVVYDEYEHNRKDVIRSAVTTQMEGLGISHDKINSYIKQYDDLIRRRTIDKDCRKDRGGLIICDIEMVIDNLYKFRRTETDAYMEAINALQAARLQRYWGTRLSYHSFIHNPSNFESGIHLLLHGLECMVYELYEQFNECGRVKKSGKEIKWTGFFNVDPNPRNIMLLRHLSIISLPLHELLTVVRLINSVLHEAAHALFIALGVDDYIRRLEKKKNNLNANRNSKESISSKGNKDRVESIETLCDIIVFNYGYKGDIDLYLDRMSDSFNAYEPKQGGDSLETIKRLLGVFFYERYIENTAKRGADYSNADESKYKYIVKEFLKYSGKHVDQHNMNNFRHFINIHYTSCNLNQKRIVENQCKIFLGKFLKLMVVFANDKVVKKYDNKDNLTDPLIDILGHKAISKAKYDKEKLKNVVAKCSLTEWGEFIGSMSPKKYQALKNRMCHEFMLEMTEHLRNDKEGRADIMHQSMAVWTTFDMSMRTQLWRKNRENLNVFEEIV